MMSNQNNKGAFMKRTVSLLLTFCMLLGLMLPLSTVTATAAAPTSYTTIRTNSTASVSITSSGGAKYFKFVPTQSGTYKFYSTNYSGDPYGALLSASGSTLVTNDDGGGSYNFSITYACTANTTYYIKAYMNGSRTGSYTLNVQTVSVDCNHNYVNGTCTICGNQVDKVVNAPYSTFSLFNSGRTGDGCEYNYSSNYDEKSYTNGGYDLYAAYSSIPKIQLGLSFLMSANATEGAQVTIYAFDVDEGSGERDCIRLVDETTGTRTVLTNTSGKDYLSGQDWRWSTTTFTIPANLLVAGHSYHFENEETVSGWVVYIRTVDLQINGLDTEPIPDPDPSRGISYANLTGSISSSGVVSTNLIASAYLRESYSLEYKATYLAEGDQKGSATSTVTIPTTQTSFTKSFNLESGAPRGTYEITVYIRYNGVLQMTRSFTASYGYSAVSYNENGGSNNKPTDRTSYSSGNIVTVQFDPVPSKYGYVFLGWSTDRNATRPMYTQDGTKTFTIGSSDVTLYAVWGPDVCEHEWEQNTETEATCTTDGLAIKECSLCGETEDVVLPKLGHHYVNRVCTRCGDIVPSEDSWDGTKDPSWYNSTDTEFTIYTAEQLAGLAQLVNDGNTFSGKTIYLGADIDLLGYEWIPIGYTSDWATTPDTHGFMGTFNGNYHSITNLAMYAASQHAAALFGATYQATILNVEVADLYINVTDSANFAVAGLVAVAYDTSIQHCKATGMVSAYGAYIKSMGALVGYGKNITIRDSYATTTLTVPSGSGHNAYVGGLVGMCEQGVDSVTNCYFAGVVNVSTSGTPYAAGIVGATNRATVTISHCFAAGQVIASKNKNAICNRMNGNAATVQNCYYNLSLTSSNATKTTLENLKSEDWVGSTLGWDFNNVWSNGTDYPVLRGFSSGPHVHDFVEVSRTEATCTVDGKTHYVCSCEETKIEVIKATGHDIETTIETEVTCTTDGLIIDRCTNTGCTYEKRTVVHGSHNYAISDKREATCDTAGYIEYTCSNCADKKYEYFEGKHNYVESARVEAQVGVEGKITYTCTACQDSYFVIIPALAPVLKNAAVLLIQDSLPWANDVNTSLLKTLMARGVVSSYNIINTAALATFDLTQYGVVFIANDQSTGMYERLAANTAKLEAYVRAGGNLVYGACDEGWGGMGSLTHALPGGVTTSNYYSVHNYIVNELHPIVTGVNTDNRSLRDELLKGNYCSHTYFNSATLPEGTDIILRDANGNPTLIEYTLGDGTVIASGLTWEYFYVRDHYNMVTNYSKYAYDDLLTYMVYMSNTCAHDYEVVEVVLPTCEENGYTKYVCTLCEHEYMGDIVVATGHSFSETSRTNATCTVNGEIVYSCTCGAVKTEVIVASGHSWVSAGRVEPTCTGYGEIAYTCSACGETNRELLEPTGHKYAITASVDPTCTTDGYIDFACQNRSCEATKRQTLAKLGHYYGNDNVCDRCGDTIEIHQHSYTTVVVPPTCTAMGYTEYTCSCGYSYRDSYIEKTRHAWDEGVTTILASCTADGLMTYTCKNCSATKTEIISAGHKWSEVVTVEKTCTTDGSKTKTCTECGKVEVEIIPAGHDWNEGIIIVEPTCKAEGSKVCACKVCGATQTVAIPALGHTYVNGVCTRCGVKFIDDVTPSTHPIYGMYFEIDDILSDYGPSLIDEYGLLLDYNKDAKLDKVAVYLTQDGTMWRRCIAVRGSNIQYATYVPYLSYQSDIKYTGLNHDWINIFRLSENSDGIWCYDNYATIGVNLEDAYGNLLLSLYDIGQAGAETRIFDDLDEMIAWLSYDCFEHESSEWIIDVKAPCLDGRKYKECTLCHKVLESEVIPATAEHTPSAWIVDVAPTATQTGSRHKECTVCQTVLEAEAMPVLAKFVISDVEASAGHTVRVTIDVQNNPGIIGALLTLAYDPALKLVKVEAGPAWNSLNFTKPSPLTNPCNFAWDGVNTADFSNGSIIILTFELPVNAAPGTVYQISASYLPSNMINANLEPMDIAIENGSITVANSMGDANNDGVVDVADVITLRRYLVGGYGVVINETAADMNNDGDITIADVVLLRRFLVG